MVPSKLQWMGNGIGKGSEKSYVCCCLSCLCFLNYSLKWFLSRIFTLCTFYSADLNKIWLFFFLIFFAVGGLRGRDKNQYIVIIVSVILLHLLLFDLFIIISLNWLQHYFCCYVLTTNIVITNFTIQMNYCCW